MNEPPFPPPPPAFQPGWQPPPPSQPAIPQGDTGTPASDKGLLFRRWFARLLDAVFRAPITGYAFYLYVLPELREYFSELVAFLEQPETVQPPEQRGGMFTILPLGYYAIFCGSLVLYQFLSYYLAGASPGKLLLSITVVDKNGESVKGNPLISLKRSGAEVLSFIPMLGQLIGLVNSILVLVPEHRSIFDRAASTKVVRRSS